jgi:hypothetical protein
MTSKGKPSSAPSGNFIQQPPGIIQCWEDTSIGLWFEFSISEVLFLAGFTQPEGLKLLDNYCRYQPNGLSPLVYYSSACQALCWAFPAGSSKAKGSSDHAAFEGVKDGFQTAVDIGCNMKK